MSRKIRLDVQQIIPRDVAIEFLKENYTTKEYADLIGCTPKRYKQFKKEFHATLRSLTFKASKRDTKIFSLFYII
ncbi:MAG: hypothetical protein ACRDBY_01075 [Cetobacterium sp.]